MTGKKGREKVECATCTRRQISCGQS